MSEYQYYEFRAIDRPLTQGEMDELRAISSRAAITPMSFVNVYNYGDFRGDPLELMKRYFDAFLYIANWGTRELMLRLPRGALDLELAAQYMVDESLDVHKNGDNVVLAFHSEDEEPEWEEGEGWLDALIPLRAELENGDLRALYLGWLAYAAAGPLVYEEDGEAGKGDDEVEPPIPPGLRKLSPPLKKLVEFLRVDDDLVAVAARRSQEMPGPPNRSGTLERWIHDLPDADKSEMLVRVAEGAGIEVRSQILRRFREETPSPDAMASGFTPGTRTVAELIAAAKERAEAERRAEKERQAKKRAAYLDELAGRQEQTWRRIETLIEMKKAAEYDQAVQYLADLRDLAARSGATPEFGSRLQALRARHGTKKALIGRLDKARLR